MTTPIANGIVEFGMLLGEAVEEELLPYKELFTTVVLEQVLVAAATCFRVCSSCHSCYGRI